MSEPWRPIETAPRDGTRILLRVAARHVEASAALGRWDNGRWALEAENHNCRGTCTIIIRGDAATHWALLDKPP
jgi:hypothetical protein